MNRRRLLGWLGLLPLVAVAAPVVEHMERRARRRAVRPVDGAHRGYFPNVVLRTHENRRVRLYDDLLAGRNVLLHFFRADPDDAAQREAITNLHRLQTLLGERCGRDVFLYSFSLNPERDTPGRLARYHASCGAGPGWTFVTGAPRDIESCRLRFGFVDADPRLARRKPRQWNVVLLGNEPHQRWTAASVLSRPEVLLDLVNRVAGVKA
jgi:protein SCO1